MSIGLDRRVWGVMERTLKEYDRSPGARPELWPLIHECLAFIMEHTPEEIIRGIKQCRLNTNYLLAWMILESRQRGLASEEKLQALERYFCHLHNPGPRRAWLN